MVDFVFVHGLGSNIERTWLNDKDEMWPEWLKSEFQGCRIAYLEFETNKMCWYDSSGNIFISEHGRILADELAFKGLGLDPIIFVSYSLGGLAVKATLRFCDRAKNNRYQNIIKNTIGCVFIATPHRGAELAALGRLIPGSSKNIDLLNPGNILNEDLLQWYSGYAQSGSMKTQAFYETRNTGPIKIVSAASADPSARDCDPIPIDADHISIKNVKNRDSRLYRSLVSQFSHWIRLDVTNKSAEDDVYIASVLTALEGLEGSGVGLDNVLKQFNILAEHLDVPDPWFQFLYTGRICEIRILVPSKSIANRMQLDRIISKFPNTVTMGISRRARALCNKGGNTSTDGGGGMAEALLPGDHISSGVPGTGGGSINLFVSDTAARRGFLTCGHVLGGPSFKTSFETDCFDVKRAERLGVGTVFPIFSRTNSSPDIAFVEVEADRKFSNLVPNPTDPKKFSKIKGVKNWREVGPRGTEVYKIGASSGLTTGRINAVSLDNVIVTYDFKNELGKPTSSIVMFDNIIEVAGIDDKRFSNPGDSGALVFTKDLYAIGLVFASAELVDDENNRQHVTLVYPLSEILIESSFRML